MPSTTLHLSLIPFVYSERLYDHAIVFSIHRTLQLRDVTGH